MSIKIILPVTIAITLFACNNTVEKEVEPEKIIVEQVAVVGEENHEHGEEAIVLDNGKKWVVVPSMMAFIRTMEQGVADFSTKEDPTSEDYQELAVLIDGNIRELTSNCTMEGQAHDELHKWLVPFIKLSEKFDEITEINEQQAIYLEFQSAYEIFNTFFE